MSRSTTDQRVRPPVITASIVASVVGVMAFVAGITKRWVLDPVGEAFGDLTPGAKAAVATIVVVGVMVIIAVSRQRHRTSVLSARRVVESQVGP